MRGKKIVLTLIALCLVAPFIWNGRAQESTPVLSVYPSAVYGSPLEGENEFLLEIQIADVTDLYAFGFTLKFAQLEKIITPLLSTEEPYWEEGPFLKAAGATYFAMTYDKVQGTIDFGCTLQTGEGEPGASGTGTLVQIHFKVLEAGESPLELEETTLYDNYGFPIVHSVTSGFYYGPVADLVSAPRPQDHHIKESQSFVLDAQAVNLADIPLYIKANFEMMRKDGRMISLWTGQTDLGANYYDDWMTWNYPGVDGEITGDGDPVGAIAAAEGMVGDGDLTPIYGFYMEDFDPYLVTWSSSRKRYGWYNLADLGYWEFEDVTIPEGQHIISVTIDVYAWSDRDLPSDMVDMYLWNGEVEVLHFSLGYESHLYNNYPAWFSTDCGALFDTEEKINAAAWWCEFFPYTSASVEGADGWIVSDDGNWMSQGYLSYGPPHPEWINWPDRVLAGTAPANNSALSVPGASIKYYDIPDEDEEVNGVWDIGEPAIDDIDMDGIYTNTTDILLVGEEPENGVPLTAPIEDDCAMYYDANDNDTWDVGEPAIRDADLNGLYNPYWRPAVDEFDHEWHKATVWEAIYIDAVHLTVETLPFVEPGAVIDLGPVYYGPVGPEDVGWYYVTVTVWFSYRKPLTDAAPPWNPGKTTSTYRLKVNKNLPD